MFGTEMIPLFWNCVWNPFVLINRKYHLSPPSSQLGGGSSPLSQQFCLPLFWKGNIFLRAPPHIFRKEAAGCSSFFIEFWFFFIETYNRSRRRRHQKVCPEFCFSFHRLTFPILNLSYQKSTRRSASSLKRRRKSRQLPQEGQGDGSSIFTKPTSSTRGRHLISRRLEQAC